MGIYIEVHQGTPWLGTDFAEAVVGENLCGNETLENEEWFGCLDSAKMPTNCEMKAYSQAQGGKGREGSFMTATMWWNWEQALTVWFKTRALPDVLSIAHSDRD